MHSRFLKAVYNFLCFSNFHITLSTHDRAFHNMLYFAPFCCTTSARAKWAIRKYTNSNRLGQTYFLISVFWGGLKVEAFRALSCLLFVTVNTPRVIISTPRHHPFPLITYLISVSARMLLLTLEICVCVCFVQRWGRNDNITFFDYITSETGLKDNPFCVVPLRKTLRYHQNQFLCVWKIVEHTRW